MQKKSSEGNGKGEQRLSGHVDHRISVHEEYRRFKG